jgi:hypothetical protein
VQTALSLFPEQFTVQTAPSLFSEQFTVQTAPSLFSEQFTVQTALSLFPEQFTVQTAPSLFSEQFTVQTTPSLTTLDHNLLHTRYAFSEHPSSNLINALYTDHVQFPNYLHSSCGCYVLMDETNHITQAVLLVLLKFCKLYYHTTQLIHVVFST